MSDLYWLAFGTGAAWGLTLLADGAGSGQVLLGAGPETRLVEAQLEPSEGGLRLRGEGLELAVSPAGHATGSGVIGGTERRIEAPAGSSRSGAPAILARCGSRRVGSTIRMASRSWPCARRRHADRRATGSRRCSSRRRKRRRSTTRASRPRTTGDGGRSRVGVELWVDRARGGFRVESEPSRTARPARRTGARHQAAQTSLELRAQPFRWHSRGRDGAGMYILGPPR